MNRLRSFPREANKLKVILITGSVILIIGALLAGFFYWRYNNANKDPRSEAEVTTARVIEKVGKLYTLPRGEEPTVAAIQDKTKLSEQSFFDQAQNGDYLLVYTKAKIALLYREDTNKLVKVGPVNLQDSSTDGTQPTRN